MTIPGTNENTAEVYFDHEKNDLFLIKDSKHIPFRKWPQDIVSIFYNELLDDPVAIETLHNYHSQDWLFEFIKCRYGAFDCNADLINNKINDNQEYFQCGKRSTCSYEGKRCNEVVAINGVLSKREIQIANCIANGLECPEIAEQLFISASTVATHRENIKYKIGVKNIAGISTWVNKRGLFQKLETAVPAT